jgi:hypothetical protein
VASSISAAAVARCPDRLLVVELVIGNLDGRSQVTAAVVGGVAAVPHELPRRGWPAGPLRLEPPHGRVADEEAVADLEPEAGGRDDHDQSAVWAACEPATREHSSVGAGAEDGATHAVPTDHRQAAQRERVAGQPQHPPVELAVVACSAAATTTEPNKNTDNVSTNSYSTPDQTTKTPKCRRFLGSELELSRANFRRVSRSLRYFSRDACSPARATDGRRL